MYSMYLHLYKYRQESQRCESGQKTLYLCPQQSSLHCLSSWDWLADSWCWLVWSGKKTLPSHVYPFTLPSVLYANLMSCKIMLPQIRNLSSNASPKSKNTQSNKFPNNNKDTTTPHNFKETKNKNVTSNKSELRVMMSNVVVVVVASSFFVSLVMCDVI